jgi:hypothetical protein
MSHMMLDTSGFPASLSRSTRRVHGGTEMSNGNGGSHCTQILIAIIGLVGVLGSALIANWAGIFGGGNSGATHSQDGGTVSGPQPQDDGTPPGNRPEPQTGVDVAFAGWSFDPPTPVQGRALRVRVGIENRGTRPSGVFNVEWWPGVNYPNPAKVWRVDGLRPGETLHLTYDYPGYPSWYGRIETKVVIDPDDRLRDINRDNNEWIRSTPVSKP